MRVLNTGMILHPLNWAIILLMLVIAGIAGHEMLSIVGMEPATKS
jgi:hypothetical protein